MTFFLIFESKSIRCTLLLLEKILNEIPRDYLGLPNELFRHRQNQICSQKLWF